MKAVFVSLLLFVSCALAGTSGGDISVTINGEVFDSVNGREIKLDKQNIPLTQTVLFRGIHNFFDFDPSTLEITDYTLTGAVHEMRLVTKPTVLFSSKKPTLTAAQLANPRLTRLTVKDDRAVFIVETNGGEYKIQATDTAQGGALQTEQEFGQPIEYVHVLGPEVFYFRNEFTDRINFGDGLDAVSQNEDPVNFHEMLLGKDSAEAAVQTFQDGTTSKWLVQSGGRMGGVLGEDAIELTPGAGDCTSSCQNQNQIHGSLPVPPNPEDPFPLPSAKFRRL